MVQHKISTTDGVVKYRRGRLTRLGLGRELKRLPLPVPAGLGPGVAEELTRPNTKKEKVSKEQRQ